MSQNVPRFLDEPEPAPQPVAGPAAGQPEPPKTIDTPVLLDPVDGPASIGADWQPQRLENRPGKSGTGVYALTGFGLILTTWFVFSVVTSLIGYFDVSPMIGTLASLLCFIGAALLIFAAVCEWRSLRQLKQVERLRLLLSREQDRDMALALCREWLRHVRDHVPDHPQVETALTAATSTSQIHSVIRHQVADPLRAAAQRIGLRAASEASALVALSPHSSWDGMIVMLRGARLVRQVAQLYGLRPGPCVIVALLGRTMRAAVETAAVDLASQTAAEQFLNQTPILRHISALSGAGTAAFRLYRLSSFAAKACCPVAD